MSDEDTFRRELRKLVGGVVKSAEDNPELGASVIERMSAELGIVIGVISGGNAKVMDRLVAGTEAYVHESAVHTANMRGFIEKLKALK